ncbi:M20/M25/M40 family metallo-hydrolase [Streptomyces sp. NPDC052644]
MSHVSASRAVLPAILAGLALLGLLAVLGQAPPQARGEKAPPEDFSAGRAWQHLEEIARHPHPTGTAANERVREYVADAARELGAEVRVQSGDAIHRGWGSPFPGGTVHNVIARVAGTSPQTSGGRALLVVSHYDSVPTSRGAADDGAAVASMLETMRALKESGPVRNDVVFLFTDGEELGLLGAELFVREEDMEDYGAVLNWEARGSSGPVMMFETHTGNAALIRAYADTGTRPSANSLAYEVYRRMPNGSDFTVFRNAGVAGLNTAFLHGFHDYHAPSDDPEHLSRDSVQHQGETMLGLVRALGDQDLRGLREDGAGDAVYFDLFTRVLVRYPADWALPLAAASLLGLATLLWRGARSAALRIKAVAVVAGTALGAVLVAALGAFGLWTAAAAAAPHLAALPLSEPYERGLFAAAFLGLAAAVLMGACRLLRGRGPAELLGGVLTVTAVVLLALAVALPGASYLFQWPLLAGLPALWWACREKAGERPLPGQLLAAAAPAVAVVLFAPLTDALLVALGIPLASAAILVTGLGALTLLPLLTRTPRLGGVAAGAAALSLALLATGLLRSGFSEEHPRPNSLVYVRDLAEGRALWLSGDPEPDGWTRRVLGDDPDRAPAGDYYPQWDEETVLLAEAPKLELPAPEVTPLPDTGTVTAADGTRQVRFRAASRRGAWQLMIRLPRERLEWCTVAGERLDAAALDERGPGRAGTDRVAFFFTGAPSGVEIVCTVRGTGAVAVEVSDYSLGLPDEAARHVGPRPPATVPVAFGYDPYDAAVVRRVTEL